MRISSDAKLLPFDKAPALFGKLREEGKKIVQCHGTFDLLHPGHFVHFEEAKSLGDVLVVTITGEKYVNKGPGRPYFNDILRAKSLTGLSCVDYVVVVPYPAAVEAIECVSPDVYCKGKEYEDASVDITGNIHDDLATVERLGGRVAYVGSVVFSSTQLLNRHFETYPPEVKAFCRQLRSVWTADAVCQAVDDFEKLNVLVVGDTIFDRYSTVSVQGLTSKNRILSGRFISENMQAGGALAVFRHIREFTPNVSLVSLVGTEGWIDSTLREYVSPAEDRVLRVPGFTTVVKHRFVEPLCEGNELNKLFSVNYIDERHPGKEVHDALCARIEKHIAEVDLVVAMDFGHGLFGEEVRRLVEDRAPFLALNCQTNSNNHGFNIINRQYRRADCFSLDKMEISLACGKRDMDFAMELEGLRKELKARYAWLTRGAVETVGLHESCPAAVCPAFEDNVIDTVGAGDAFCAVASLAAARDLPADLATFLGQLAGAQAVRIVGNTESIRKDRFLKSVEAMLNF